MEKGTGQKLTQQLKLEPELTAPVTAGQKLGEVKILADGVLVCEYDLAAAEDIAKMTFKAALDMTFKELVRLD
jgi:hypothetical protein